MQQRNRKKTPSKATIVDYWASFFAQCPIEQLEIYPVTMWQDWGEPDCWACGAYSANCNDIHEHEPDPSRHTWKKILAMWNQASLERHHILPVALGGDNCPSNFVLLCWLCHRSAPHTVSAETFWYWMRNRRQEIGKLSLTVLQDCAKMLEIDPDGAADAFRCYAEIPAFQERVERQQDGWIGFGTETETAIYRAWMLPLLEEYVNFTAGCAHRVFVDSPAGQPRLQIPMVLP